MTAVAIRHGEPRADALRPAVFDPADFELVDYIDTGWDNDNDMPRDPWAGRYIREYGLDTREDADEGVWVCDHCGFRGIVYLGVVRQKSTGNVYVFGQDCAQRAAIEDRATLKLVQLKKLAANAAERMRIAINAAHYLNDNADIRVYLMGIPRGDKGEPAHDFDFVNSMDLAVNKYGHLTDRQATALRKVMAGAQTQAERDAERAAQDAAKGPAPEGRQTVVGDVVKVKTGERGEWGEWDQPPKLILRLDNGSAVYLTLPRIFDERYYAALHAAQDAFREQVAAAAAKLSQQIVAGEVAPDAPLSGVPERFDFPPLVDWLLGKRIQVTATFTVSDRDEHFAFGKRPTGATFVEGEA